MDSFYTQEYLKLRPCHKEDFLMQVRQNRWRTDTDGLVGLITQRFVRDFADFFGLVTVRREQKSGQLLMYDFFVQKTALLDKFFQVDHYSSSADVYTFEISLAHHTAIKREIHIQGDATFRDLHKAIFLAYHRHDPHLFSFYRKHKKNFQPRDRAKALEITHQMIVEDSGKDSSLIADECKTRIDSVGMKEGSEWEYLFDFGDEWVHDIHLKTISKPIEGQRYPMVHIMSGESPSQYSFV